MPKDANTISFEERLADMVLSFARVALNNEVVNLEVFFDSQILITNFYCRRRTKS